jgi:hypothetical protein
MAFTTVKFYEVTEKKRERPENKLDAGALIDSKVLKIEHETIIDGKVAQSSVLDATDADKIKFAKEYASFLSEPDKVSFAAFIESKKPELRAEFEALKGK